ncbi:MAG: LacI family transcriptional regulator [Novosphingobium sp.]|nr:LacI family transcriptional regulator [Novosphingobium sp.]
MRGIATGMNGPTIADIARLAGVSEHSVRRAINKSPLLSPQARSRIEQVIAETGFVALPSRREPMLKRNALIALMHDDPLGPSLIEVQAGISAALKGSDLALCVHHLDCHHKPLLRALGDFLEYHRPSGILLMPPLSDQDELAGLAWEYGCSCVRLGAAAASGEPGWVSSADREAAADAVHHLVRLGHRRIAFISGPEDSRQNRLRELGWLDAMAEHGLDRGPSLVATSVGNFESGLAAAALLLEVSPRPTAILAANDEIAAGALHAAMAAGIAVPAALSIVGFGDALVASRLCPTLTTVRVPLLEMAHAAASWLIDPGSAEAVMRSFPGQLIERGTTAPLHATATEAGSFAFQSG